MYSRRRQNLVPKLNSGYTLLFAVIAASLVLGVAVFILSASKKQYELSVAARDSMYAIYAADSGIECLAANNTLGTTSQSTILCNGTNVTVSFSHDGSPDTNIWPIDVGHTPAEPNVYKSNNIFLSLPQDTCAVVSISDGSYGVGGIQYQKRVIESRGYNYCDSNLPGPAISPRTVERALRFTYQ